MYCTIQDIESYYLNKSFNYSDYVSNMQIESFIIAESSGIDAILATKYNLPIMNHFDLMILKTICERMVVATIDDITREKTEEGKFERGRNTRKEAKEWLDMIKNGQMRLNSSKISSVISFNDKDSSGNTVKKRFKDSNIEPTVTTMDRERRRYVG